MNELQTMKDEFHWRQATQTLPAQIRGMRAQKKWTQKELARRAGIHWSTVIRLEDDCSNASIRVLERIASAFDVALIIRFGPWSQALMIWRDGHAFIPASYEDDQGL